MSRRMIPDSATIGLWRLDETAGVPAFSPTSLSGCVLWLDGQDASTFNTGSPSEGVTIDNWNDKSGQGHHANVRENTPNYSTTGLNGYPCLHCDGESLRTTFSFAAPPFTLFAVARYGSGTKGRIINGGANMLFGWWGGYTWSYYYEGWVENGGGPGDTNVHSVCCNMSSGGLADFWFDGKLRKQRASGGSGSSTFGNLYLGRYAGGGEYSDCYVGEVLIYNRILDPGETARVLEWLNAKWNIHTADVSVNVLPATVVGATKVAVADMPFAHARQFVRASSQRIYVADNAVLRPVNVSIECWFTLATIPGTGEYYVLVERISSTAGYQFNFFESTLTAYIQNGTSATATYTTTWALDTWYHAAMTYDGAKIRIFVNGALVAEQAKTGDITYVVGKDFVIGNQGTGSYYHNGKIAEVRLSNRARAPWEIYNAWKALPSRDPATGFGVET